MDQRHHQGEFACSQTCILGRLNYFEDLHETCIKLCERKCETFTLIVIDGPILPDSDFIRLSSPALREKYLAITKAQPESVIEYSDFIETSQKITEELVTCESEYLFDCHLELVLWQAVTLRNAALLISILSRRSVELPECLLSALLHQAIKYNFMEGILALLDYGANPNSVFPDHAGLEKCDTLPIHRILNTDEHFDVLTADLASWAREYEPSSINRVIRKFVEKGADLMKLDEFNGKSTIHLLAHLALMSPETATYILEIAPASSLSLRSGLIWHPEIERATPFETALIDAAEAGSMASRNDRQEKISRIMSAAILPMLRAGAKLTHDPFQTHANGSFNLFLSLLIISRDVNWWRSVTNLLGDIRNDASIHAKNTVGEVLFHTWLKDFYPRSLSAMCRSVILRNLPVGYRERSNAIDSLKLPFCLSEYLKFREYDSIFKVLNSAELFRVTADE